MTDSLTIIGRLDAYLAERHAALDNPAGFGRDLINDLHDLGVYRCFMPTDCGGFYGKYSVGLGLVSSAAYHSLELSLMLGISSSLFIMPVLRWAKPDVRAHIFADMQKNRLLGGMMMTEPDYGTNIMGIATSFKPEGSGYRLRGTKHWAGLSGRGEYWVVSARKERENGVLGRDIDFFIVKSDQPGYAFQKFYPAAGLTSISYGITNFDVEVQADYKLCGPDTNIRVLYDILNRSRISMSAISKGVCKRLLEDAKAYSTSRIVFGKPVISNEQAQLRLADIQTGSTVCSAAVDYTGDLLDNHEGQDQFIEMLTANIVKVVTSDLQNVAAHSAVQLYGGQGFRKDHYVGKAFVDSRPFQIFEGSNDVLYEAIAAQLMGEARKLGITTLSGILAKHPLLPVPVLANDPFSELPMPSETSQVDRVLFGKIVSRYIAIGLVQRHEKNPDLAAAATDYLASESEGHQRERTSSYRKRFVQT